LFLFTQSKPARDKRFASVGDGPGGTVPDRLDASDWELRQVLRQLRKSGTPLFEWLQSFLYRIYTRPS